MAELFVKPVWILIFGESKGPCVIEFEAFKKAWDTEKTEENDLVLDKNAEMTLLHLDGDWEKNRAMEVTATLTYILTTPNKKGLLPRDDYDSMRSVPSWC